MSPEEHPAPAGPAYRETHSIAVSATSSNSLSQFYLLPAEAVDSRKVSPAQGLPYIFSQGGVSIAVMSQFRSEEASLFLIHPSSFILSFRLPARRGGSEAERVKPPFRIFAGNESGKQEIRKRIL